MEAKEKAKELVEKFHLVRSNSQGDITHHLAKQCALICCGEMIKQNGEIYLTANANKSPEMIDYYKQVNGYLFGVKSEIEKL